MRQNKASTATEQPDDELLDHIQRLGLETVQEYRDWCVQNGFGRKVKKHWKQRCREREFARAAIAQKRLKQKKREKRSQDVVIQGICEGHLSADDVTLPHLQRLCESLRSCKSKAGSQFHRKTLLRLLTHLHRCRAKFFDGSPAISELGQSPGNTYVEALALIATNSSSWSRPVEDWRPRTRSARRQFASLVRHLFVKYEPMPSFFDSVWFAGRSKMTDKFREWYLHVASGQNFRHCDLPIAYTKKMAHHFMDAPSTVTIPQALRWGQVLGLGGGKRLAEAIVATRLTESFEHDEFWTAVVRWFVSHPMLDTSHVGPIVDYIHHQRFVPEHVFVAGGRREDTAPPQPHLSMKGRTPEVLLRKVNEWHRKLANDNTHQVRQWQPTGIGEFEHVEGSFQNGTMKIWTMRELLSSKALVAEGRKLKHCVATYATSCSQGRCSIWTMEVESNEGQSKLLTVEVRNAARIICQVRGKLNRLPSDKERKILRRWAESSGLKMASYV